MRPQHCRSDPFDVPQLLQVLPKKLHSLLWESLLRVALKCSEDLTATGELEDEAVSTHMHTHTLCYHTPYAPILVQAAKGILELTAAVCTFVQGALCMDKPPLHTPALLDSLGALHGGRRRRLDEESTIVSV